MPRFPLTSVGDGPKRHLGYNLAASLIPTLADGGQQHLIIALFYFVLAMIVVFATDARTLRTPASVD